MAAERTGRRGRGIELDPAYADVAVRRWQERTGGRHSPDGRSFAGAAARDAPQLRRGRRGAAAGAEPRMTGAAA